MAKASPEGLPRRAPARPGGTRRSSPLPARAAGRRPPAPPHELEVGVGTRVPADGDLVYLIDALYREFAVKRGFAPVYGDLKREIARLIEQMDAATAREYFSSSLFLNYVTYENEMADKLAAEITEKARRSRR